jgi:hypothetical protein
VTVQVANERCDDRCRALQIVGGFLWDMNDRTILLLPFAGKDLRPRTRRPQAVPHVMRIRVW